MSADPSDKCCPRFDPAPWDEKEIRWQNKRFVKDRVTSFLHIPLNFGAAMRRSMARIEAAGAASDQNVVLSEERSLWGADVYIAVTKDVPGARMATISGTFLSKVFDGPYRDMPKWIVAMKGFVHGRGMDIKRMYSFYTTCPACAKKRGKNYVVLLVQTQE